MSNEPNSSAVPPEPSDKEALESPEIPAAEVPDEGTAEETAPETPTEPAEAERPPAEPPAVEPAPPEPIAPDGEAVTEAEPLDEDEESDDDVEPIEYVTEEEEEPEKAWYILKVQVNREESIRDALQRRVQIEGLDRYFGDIVVPTEDVAEFTKTGKRRIVKRKLYPGYIMVHMAINDDTWFLVRETPGIGDFTGSQGKPTPMDAREVERILKLGQPDEEGESQVKTAIPFKPGDRVRVKEGYFQNTEGEVEAIDEANGRVTVMIVIFGRSTPVELEHWQIEPL